MRWDIYDLIRFLQIVIDLFLLHELEHLIAGLIAGSMSTAILHPLDLIKVRYQVYESKGSPYKNVVSAFRTVVQHEGYHGLYQGLTPALFASAISWGGYFFFYEYLKKSILQHRQTQQQHQDDGNGIFYTTTNNNEKLPSSIKQRQRSANSSSSIELNSLDHLMAGVGAGSVMVLMTNPLWLAKTRLQLQGGYEHRHSTATSGGNVSSKSVISTELRDYSCNTNTTNSTTTSTISNVQRKYTGLTDALVSILREEGVSGLYKGLVPALLLTSNGAIQFAIYENFKSISLSIKREKALHNNKSDNNNKIKDQSAVESMVMGGASKILASLLTYPYQVVKSRLQQRIRIDIPSPSPSYGVRSASERTINVSVNVNTQSSSMHTQYRGTFDCLVKIWRYEGIRGIFKGIVPHCLRVVPSAALTLLIYEESLKFIKK
eukprot:gene7169-14599_t